MATMKDGLGFEELGDVSDAGSKVAQIWITGSITTESDLTTYGDFVGSGTGSVAGAFTGSSFTDRLGDIRPVGVDNASALYGYRVQAGSAKTNDSNSGGIVFKTSFADNDWFMCLTVAQMSNPYKATVDGSGATPYVSGTRHASGCSFVAGSQTVVDWIAVGL